MIGNFANITFRDLMSSANAWGPEEGREVYMKLLKFVEANAGVKIFRVSFKGVERTDISFPRESLIELAKRYRGDKGFCIYDLTDAALIEIWDAAADRTNQPIFSWDSNGYTLLGPSLNKGYGPVFNLVLSRDSIRATDAVKELGIGLSNASSKLKQLWEKGYILRKEDVAESGGIEFNYFKIQ